jgi:two-component system cell cycle response regulator
MNVSTTHTASDEVVSLAQRVRYMQLFRVAVAAGAVLFALFGPEVADGAPGKLGLSLVYLGVIPVWEVLWRVLGRRVPLFGAMLIVDGVYLAWLSYATGGAVSPLRNLILLHIIAVTLLASYSTGLKLAMWYSILLLMVHHAQKADILPRVTDAELSLAAEYQRLVAFIAVFWLVTLATASFSAINERELRRRRYDLEALAQMAAQLETRTEAPDVAEVLLDGMMDAYGFARGVVLGTDDGKVSVLAHRGEIGPVPEGKLGPDEIVRDAWEARETLLVSELDPASEPNLYGLLPDAHNLLVAPLMAEGGFVGALVVEHSLRAGSRIERRVVSMVDRSCDHVALALRNAALLEQVKLLAATDGLTGLPNRRTFEETLEREVSRAARTGQSVSLVMLDIDHFKRLNDTHGHQMGDEVLRQVAAAVKANCRNFDTPARYGGEELAVILPGSSAEESMAIAERVRGAISEAITTVAVTASGGVATFPTHATDAESLVKKADAALYEAKGEGRDQVKQPESTVADEVTDSIDEVTDSIDEVTDSIDEVTDSIKENVGLDHH